MKTKIKDFFRLEQYDTYSMYADVITRFKTHVKVMLMGYFGHIFSCRNISV